MRKRLWASSEHGMYVFPFKIFVTSLQVRADIIDTLNITYSTLIRDSTISTDIFPIIEKERSPMQSMFFYKVNKVLY